MNPLKGGGVVVLVKRGITVIKAIDEVFRDSAGSDALARKGFFAVNFAKGAQPYWVLGTHTQANEGEKMEKIRLAQYAQMMQFVNLNTGAQDRVVFAGDMNTFTGDNSGGRQFANETAEMLEALNAMEGDLVPRGFWLPLDDPLYASADNVRNHYVNHLDFEYGAQLFDRVLAFRGGVTPHHMRRQIVPMKSSDCFVSEAQPGNSDDLSDHFALFASLCYKQEGCAVEPVSGHRGSGPVFPSMSPNCDAASMSMSL